MTRHPARLTLIVLMLITLFPIASVGAQTCDPTQDYIARGRVALTPEGAPLAIAEYTCAITLDPNAAPAYYGRAEASALNGDYASALPDYEAALSIEPDLALAYYGRGIARAALDDPNGAIADFNAVEVRNLLLPGLLFERGSAYLAAGDPTAAVRDLTLVIDADSQATEAYIQRGLAYTALGDDLAAIDDFSAALVQDPDNVEVYVYRALRYITQGNLLAALADYFSAVALDPYNPVFYFQLGRIYSDLSELERGNAQYSAAVTLDPRFTEAYFQRGSNYARLADHARAVDDFSRAIALAPDYTDAYRQRVISLKALERYDEAIADYTAIIALAPDDIDAYWSRGELFFYIKTDYPAAIADMSEVIARESGYADGEPFSLRGISYARTGSYASAIPDLQTYLGFVGEDPTTRLLLTVAQTVVGDLTGATESVYAYADAAGLDLESAALIIPDESLLLTTTGTPIDAVYTFVSLGETRVTISAELNDGAPDPVLVLLDPNGDVIAANDDLDPSARSLTAVLFDVPLILPGTYTLLVTTLPDSIGTVRLTISGA